MARSEAAAALVAAWRGRGRHVDVAGGRVFVVDTAATEGSGADPLLVLHGFPTCSFDWRPVLDLLRRDRRVVLFDFLGFGLSDKPDRRYGIRLHADTAEQVATALGLERVVLVAHDMGDTVAGELLARDMDGTLPFSVSASAVSNGSIYIEMARLTPGQQLLLALDDARLGAAPGGDPGTGFRAGVASTFSSAHPASPEEIEAMWRLAAHGDGHTLLARTIRYIEDRRTDQDRFTGAIETHPAPLGIVWGSRDPVAVYAMAERLAATRPDAAFVTLDDVGHYPMVETPERFAAALGSVLPT